MTVDMQEGPADMPRALTREFLMEGTLGTILARAVPGLRILTEEERAASLRAVLAQRPPGSDGVRVFAYGSLMWNPTIHFLERRHATAQGWHRAFCLGVQAGRGSPENPGLMLGLQPGGTCDGEAFLIAEAVMEHELSLLWRREMIADGYIPSWVRLEHEGAYFADAIAFTINPQGANYCGNLSEDEVVRRLATAEGGLGTAAEYLFRTRDGLRLLGMADPLVERLAKLVEAVRGVADDLRQD
jgi:glutathione-specific gamma-glutamylcyclotransferase